MMPSVSDKPKTLSIAKNDSIINKKRIIAPIQSMLYLPKNVYLLLFFTLGKGMQLSMPYG